MNRIDKKIQKEPCVVCGKTLAQRVEEGWEFDPKDPEEVMVDFSVKWCGAICPVCREAMVSTIVSLHNDKEYMQYVLVELLKDCEVDLHGKINLKNREGQ